MRPHSRVNLAAPSGKQVINVFVLYLGLQILLLPALVSVVLALLGKTVANWDVGMQHWFSVAAMIVTFVWVVTYGLFLQNAKQRRIWERWPATKLTRIVAFLTGSVSWLIALPCVALVQLAVASLLGIFVTADPIEQVAVTHLRDTLNDPGLFFLTLLGIVIFVPISEELLFRGFLQNWLTKRWGARNAILGASAVFTLFHFSIAQGWTNAPILSALFVLALLLGTLYQRFGSLWAPIGLHCTFNAASAWMIAGPSGMAPLWLT